MDYLPSRVLVVTPTLGRSVYWSRVVGSIQAMNIDVLHICVGPENFGENHLDGRVERIFLTDEGGGMYAAINQGVNYAKNRDDWGWFTYLNDDDELILQDTSFLISRRGAVYGRAVAIDIASKPLFSIPVAKRAQDLFILASGGIIALAQQGWFIDRGTLLSVGIFDSTFRFTGDIDLIMRLLDRGVEFRYVDGICGLFRICPGQLSKNSDKMSAEKKKVISRYEGRFSPLVFAVTKVRFRLQNLLLYFGRLRKYGFRSVAQIYEN